jgi:DNA primase
VGRGYNRDEIIKAGLAVRSEKGNSPYDRFRGRIIFPIFNANSQVIGFGARIFKEADKKETAKYINTPQTMLYDKSNVLYGINFAKVAVRKNNQCVLTEGYTDAIMCHQAGFENTVAVSGTALTGQHLNILKRYTDNLLLSFDMDLAGDNATKRGINLAENQGFNLKIVNSYSEKDPADIIKDDPKIWEESIKNARGIMDFYFDSAFSKYDKSSPQGKKEISKIILPAIKRLQNKIEQSHWIQKLVQRLEIREEAIIEELNKVKIENNYQELASDKQLVAENNFTPQGRKKLLEDKIISLILKDPYSLNLIKEKDYCLFSENIKNFLENIKKASSPIFASEDADTETKLKAVFADISEKQEYKDFFGRMFLKAEVEFEKDGPDEVELCLSELKKLELKNELGIMSKTMSCGEENLKEFDKKAKELHFKK